MKYLYAVFFCALLISCSDRRRINTSSDVSDESQIVSVILRSQKVKEGMYLLPDSVFKLKKAVTYKLPDSIFIVKSKKAFRYNLWPRNIGSIQIGYLAESKQAVASLERKEKITDKPMRYIVTTLSINTDSAKAVLYGINQGIDYSFKLKKDSTGWKVIDSSWVTW